MWRIIDLLIYQDSNKQRIIGKMYRLQIKMIAVETLTIQGLVNKNIVVDSTLASFTNAAVDSWQNKLLHFGAILGYGQGVNGISQVDTFN
jgi:hypothetical protein